MVAGTVQVHVTNRVTPGSDNQNTVQSMTAGMAQVHVTNRVTTPGSDVRTLPCGVSKYASELDLRAARDMFGLDFIVVRPHNVYGPGQNMVGLTS
jgi:nucleoside-diphosphate-sugar epimerase